MIEDFNGQAGQDIFVQWALQEKRGGTFLEIGSNDPIQINNSYVLEKDYGWRGIMVEYSPEFLPAYLEHRPTATLIIQDATTVDYVAALTSLDPPPPGKVVDYLQIDLEVSNDSTMGALKRVEETMRAGYRYAVVTFEHDQYSPQNYDTRARSRPIFEQHGYVRVFSDVQHRGCPYEDWYVHPDLVDMERIRAVQTDESLDWKQVMNRLRDVA